MTRIFATLGLLLCGASLHAVPGIWHKVTYPHGQQLNAVYQNGFPQRVYGASAADDWWQADAYDVFGAPSAIRLGNAKKVPNKQGRWCSEFCITSSLSMRSQPDGLQPICSG